MLDVLNKCSSNNEKFWDILFDRFWTTMPQGVLHVKLIEPPCTERYARWCERSVDEIIAYLLLDYRLS